MNRKILNSIIGGIAGTAVMTMIMMVAPMMGLPKMSPPDMLAMMMGAPVIAGWIAHFMIGVIFATVYYFVFNEKVNLSSKALKGTVFGFTTFIFAQIVMAAMGAIMGTMPKPEGSMILMMVGSIMGHVIFGIIVAISGMKQSAPSH